MLIARREFVGGSLAAGLALQLPGPAMAQQQPALSAALAAIRAYGELHLQHFRLPGLTLGVTTPDGFAATFNFGYANADARTPIAANTLFQVGSISKLMNAALIHQFAAEGRLRLADRISDLLPAVPLPSGNSVTVQHLLDHVAGIAGDSPVFPAGGLWTAYPPGAHWHYSNTGYVILGMLIEHVGGKPLAQLLGERIFAPLDMHHSRGAIIAQDRALYAQGYEAADELPFAVGVALAPAPWIDMTAAPGNIASTAEDMAKLLRALAAAAQGRGGLGLSPSAARAFTGHAVPSDAVGMAYGNGLMHVASHGRSYLHHTGGMVSFSSSFHLDVASGAGAFASASLSGFCDYRPRLLTAFATDAMTNALAGRPAPPAPSLAQQLSNAASYVGRYAGPGGEFEVQPGNPLTIVAAGEAAALQPWGGEIFRTTHPAFREFSLMLERRAAGIALASWGPHSYVRTGSGAQLPSSDPELAKLAGRYVDDNPWFGLSHVVERGGRLWLGTDIPMVRMGSNLWRIGHESWSPERGAFADFVDGRPQTFIFSGEKFTRHDT